MNRLFIILTTVAGVTAAAWAIRHHQAASIIPAAAVPSEETPTCCQKAPSRASFLQAKPPQLPSPRRGKPSVSRERRCRATAGMPHAFAGKRHATPETNLPLFNREREHCGVGCPTRVGGAAARSPK
jgi:hypothetical protein